MNTWQFLLLLTGSTICCHAGESTPAKYPASYNSCNGCTHLIRNGGIFFDDGGQSNPVGDAYQLNTFIAQDGYELSFYFTELDLPQGAKINVYEGAVANAASLVKSFQQIDKTKNITARILTVEYIPAENTTNAKGWEAHIDERVQPGPDPTAEVLSPPESDCPYAIPLCQNSTVIALGGQYNDLGAIYDDEGSCYAGTGSGGSVWYTFSPQSNGPLDFTLIPQGTTDYDFVLWDITQGCQTGKRVELSCNYSLYTGNTGMSSLYCNEAYGSCTSNDCSNQSKYSDCNRFNNRINVQTIKQYAICINFYSGSNDGFILTFKNEASSVAITDNTPPRITNAYSTNCTNATNFHLIFSEWVTCASIQNTDFTLAGHTFSIVNTNCVNGRTNNIDITVSPGLTPGTYPVLAQNILDLCGNSMNSTYNIVVGVAPNASISTPQLVCKAPNGNGGFSYSPGSQTLTASGGTSYYWYDGQTGPTAVYSANAPKTVSVTVVSGACAAVLSTTINVAAVSVSLGPDQLYCGTPITLTATPAVPGATYTFYRNPTILPPGNGTQIQTGASNTLTVSPASNTVYRVVVTFPNGCRAFDDMVMVTNPPANATINLPSPLNYCLSGNPIILTATPTGGTFSGPGVSNNTFYPAVAGVGTHTINYTVTNACGTFNGTRNITVSNGTLPTVNLNPTYCVTNPNVTLNPVPICGTFSGPGIIQAGFCILPIAWTTRPVFSPSSAGIGTHQLLYRLVAPGCSNVFNVQVLGPGAIPTISGAAGPYCTTSPSITLSGSPSGGTFSGTGITGNTFNPATAGVGTHNITYTVFSCGESLTNTVPVQVVATAGSATISYSPNTFCNTNSTVQNVVFSGSTGGTYSATPAGLSINAATGAITPNTSALGTYTVRYTIPAAGGCPQFQTTTSVTISSAIAPSFAAIGPLCQNSTAPALPSTSTNSINGTWSPSTINTSASGTTPYTFTPNSGQCATTASMNITVNAQTTPNFAAIGPLCQNSTAPALPSTSTNSINGTWSPATISTSASGTTPYTFTPNSGQCATTASMNITVNAQTTPNFAAIGPLCQNSTAPALPSTSTNSINGTWSPATISTSASGTTPYTFTPNSGQCATTASMNITVSSQITPAFGAIGPLCENSTAPALPASSTNSVNGTWSPSTISTSTAGTSSYVFTPNSGQCAIPASINITIDPQLTPNFAAIGPLCQNSTAPVLPISSTNSIPGSWSPSTINTSASGTSAYTFTPNIGQCATTSVMNITVDPELTPGFAAIGPLCQNSTAPTLPATSTNSINGTWSPSVINTSASGTAPYTFTPNSGQCATTSVMNITVDPELAPNFAAIGPLCQNSTAPTLPSTSTNSINGTWSPSIINTSTSGTSAYTFTPNSGQCATSTSMNITVDAPVTPNFAAIGPLCQNSTAPALPPSSTNSISGTWSPSTINTTTTGTSSYTFTPNSGQCATTSVMNITVDPELAPNFAAIGPLCQNSTAPALPTTSTNSVNGTWSPSTINTTVSGTSAYTFTPASGQCAVAASMNITVDPELAPNFAAIGPLCQNSIAPTLPSTSTNSINGTWSPPVINTSTMGTTPYTFTPNSGQCATTSVMNITVDPELAPNFAAVGPLCQNSTAPALPTTSTNSVNGTWSPSIINTSTSGTSAYTFTPASGQCAVAASLNITVDPELAPNFAAIGPLCQNSTAPALPTTSTNSVNGSWSPSTINTTASGTSAYTFTPASGQCAVAASMNITVDPELAPNFAAIGPLCQNSIAPTLPTTSTNSINGSWSPSTINTTASGTSAYTFTPNSGQCATTSVMNITVDLQITPSFTGIGPLCQNSTAPTLPATSNNSINGSWSPSTINTSASGTTPYTFTPNSGQCATTSVMNITVDPELTPSFAAIGPLCQNSTAPTLPSSSTNSVNGTWSPSTVNTSASGTSLYTFTPASGQCAVSASMNITVDPELAPDFAAIGPLCQNSTAPTLPSTSTNSVNGTWSPSTINTSASGTSAYTFTPASGQCAVSTSMNITVDPELTPNFVAIGPLCQNSTAPTLPSTSINSINGTWSPPVVNTSTMGTTPYTFTPNSGQCATTSVMNITVDAQITPGFTAIGPLCQNSTAPNLPATSNNSINGSWSPSAINTSASGTTPYTFTPNSGQCAVSTIQNIIVNPVKTTNINRSVCQGQSVTIGSQTFSTSGNFSVSLLTSEGCDSTVNLNLVVHPLPVVSVTSPVICAGSTAVLSASGANTYTWSGGLANGANPTTPPLSSTTSFIVTGTDANGCMNTATSLVTVNPTKSTALNQTICQGESVSVGSQTFTTTGNYSVNLQTSLGCDSTVNLSLLVNPAKSSSVRQTICEGQSVTIGGQNFPTTGVYTIQLQSSLGCDSTVTLDLTVKPQLLVDVALTSTANSICENDAVTFTATPTNPGSAPVYQWYLNGNPVGTNSTVYTNNNLSDSDEVWVQLVSSEMCVLINPAISEKIPVQVSSIDYTIPALAYCAGNSGLIDLNITQTNYTVTWTNGSYTQTTMTDEFLSENMLPGYIGFNVQFGNNCSVKDSVFVDVYANPVVDAIADELLVKYGIQVQLDAVGTTITGYNWTSAGQLSSTTIKNPTTIVSTPAWYIVTVTNANGCRTTDSVFINMTDECMETYVFVPNGFTPNNDGLNDCFAVLYAPPLTEFKMVIFDRWGEKIFEAADVTNCWDGSYKGVSAMVDSYSYVIGFRCYNGKFIMKKGTVTLVR